MASKPIEVVLRFRPSPYWDNFFSIENNDVIYKSYQQFANNKISEQNKKISFTRIMGPDKTQEDVYAHLAPKLIKDFFDGCSGLVFAYGLTNSGKTFTVEGNKNAAGILPRLIGDILRKLKEEHSSMAERAQVVVSHVEIYQEKIYDLLSDIPGELKKSLKFKQINDETFVSGATHVPIGNIKEAIRLYRKGCASRHSSSTCFNKNSSRSHSLFTIKLAPNGKKAKKGYFPYVSKICVADLAGAERTSTVDEGENRASTVFDEYTKINSSLLVLGRVMKDLQWNQNNAKKGIRVVPWRETAITRVLRGFFLGGGHCVMMVNVWVTPENLSETLRVLNFAAIATSIKTVSKVNNRLHVSLIKGFDPKKDLAPETYDLLKHFLGAKEVLDRTSILLPQMLYKTMHDKKKQHLRQLKKIMSTNRKRVRRERKVAWSTAIKQIYKIEQEFKSYKEKKEEKVKNLSEKFDERLKAEKFKNSSFKRIIDDLEDRIIKLKEKLNGGEKEQQTLRKKMGLWKKILIKKNKENIENIENSDFSKSAGKICKDDNFARENISNVNAENLMREEKESENPSVVKSEIFFKAPPLIKREDFEHKIGSDGANIVKSQAVPRGRASHRMDLNPKEHVSKERFYLLTVSNLKNMLRNLNLKVGGIKSDLVERLWSAVEVSDGTVKKEMVSKMLKRKEAKWCVKKEKRRTRAKVRLRQKRAKK